MCIVTSQYSVYVRELTSNTTRATTRDLYKQPLGLPRAPIAHEDKDISDDTSRSAYV